MCFLILLQFIFELSDYPRNFIVKNQISFLENDIFGVIGHRRYGTPESRQEKSKYYYDEELDVYIERKTGEILEYDGFRLEGRSIL